MPSGARHQEYGRLHFPTHPEKPEGQAPYSFQEVVYYGNLGGNAESFVPL